MKWINFEYSKAATRGVPRNFTKFSGKNTCARVSRVAVQLYLKKDSGTCVFL